MAKQPPKRYEPGELDRTRGRLGPLSREESKRLAELFGGEVGLERDDPALEERYRKIREASYRGRPSTGRDARLRGISRESVPPSGRVRSLQAEPGERRFLERFRLWHFASRPEFGIMRRGSAWLALWPFSKPRELLNPAFVLGSGEIFYRHIETAVLAVRGLLRRVEKNSVHQLRSPFYRRVAECIKEWEIEALHRELTRIQLRPRSVTPADFARVVFYLYRPIVQLQEIDPLFIERAVRHLFDLSILELPKRNLEADRMRKYFTVAAGELDYLFGAMPVRCYPLLLLLFSSGPEQYRPFMEHKREQLLEFFHLGDDDLVAPPGAQAGGTFDDQPLNGETEEPEEEAAGEETEQGEEPEPAGQEAVTGFRQSLLMIERLFPGSGWIRLNEKPDLFPYFDPVLKLPEGSGLVSPGDPLQHAVILASIMGELLYGFREAEMQEELTPVYEGIASVWHRFIDELLEKHYLGTLRDYCRNVERSYDFVLSEYGRRIEADLLFLRKRYLFPNLRLSVPKYLQPRQLPPVPKFNETVSSLRRLLEQLTAETGAQALRNPDAPYHFPVPNTLSRRLDSLLKSDDRGKTILNLARYTLAVAMVLEHVLEQEQTAPSPLYRHVEQREDLPIYSVTSLDTGRLLRRFEERRKPGALDPLEPTQDYDALTGLAGGSLVRQELANLLSLPRENAPVILRLRTDPARVMESARKIENCLSLFQDRLFRLFGGDFLILLTRGGTDYAGEKAREIIGLLSGEGGAGPAISIITVPENESEADPVQRAKELLREVENAIPGGELPPEPHLFLWDRETGTPVEQPRER